MGLRDLFKRTQDDESQALARVTDPVAGDRQVIDQLSAMGVNLSKPRDARFYLYLPTQDDARAAAAAAREQGYAVEVTRAAGESTALPWLALANRDVVVSEESIAEARRLFDGLAERYSGDYDGWEAATD